MKIIYSYLGQFIQPLPPVETGAALLTSCGLEVEHIESVESIQGGLKNVVTGEVLSVEPHPDADRLRVTTVKVSAEAEALQIVCGAPNVAAGQKVIVALTGAILYPQGSEEPLKIKKSKIRGVESNGMICAEDELGIGHSHDGILILPSETMVGINAAEYFQLTSLEVVEIGLTPNRTDAMSHWGVARELSAVMQQRGMEHEWKDPFSFPNPAYPSLSLPVEVGEETKCTHYSITQINIDSAAETPNWLKKNLSAIGLKSIHPVVDISNWVQHELGQPTHAFDTKAIHGKITVRAAKTNEPLTTLDGVSRKCSDQDVVIGDNQNALCLAGVMGGQDSGVTSNTESIYLECALFDAVRVRKSAKFHGIHSDSSFRFERGVDPEMTEKAHARIVNLIQEMAGGKVVGRSVIESKPFVRTEVSFRPWKAHLILGKEIPLEEMKGILQSLDFEVDSRNSAEWKVHVPGCRVDVMREIDIVEEILRIYSFDEIAPSSQFQFSWNAQSYSHFHIQHKISQTLVAQGCHEIQSLSLTKENYVAEDTTAVKILNPLSADLGVMRTTLMHGGLEAISFNIKRKHNQLRLFEMGKVYKKTEEGFHEEWMLGIWLTGPRESENSHNPSKETDFRDLRNVLEQLAQMAGISLLAGERIEQPYFSECIQYPFKKGGFQLGYVQPSLLQQHDIAQPVLYLQLPLTPFMQLVNRHQPGSPKLYKFPSVRRDLSMLIDNGILFQDIEKIALQAEKKSLKEVFLFDVYQGDKLPAGKKSYAVGFVLRDDNATMTDQQIDQCMQRIIQNLNQHLGVALRG